MKVLFEQNYLIPGERAESQAIYYLLDQDADLFNVDVNGDGIMDPLANINTNGLRFTVDGGAVGVLEFDKQLLLDKQILNWDDFVDALQPALAQAIADGLLPADTTLTVDNTLIDFTFLDDGSRSVDIPAMVLEPILKPSWIPSGSSGWKTLWASTTCTAVWTMMRKQRLSP